MNSEIQKESRKIEWRQMMIAQYGTFGTVAGVMIAALTIYASLETKKDKVLIGSFYLEDLLFIVSLGCLVVSIILILMLINRERDLAWGTKDAKLEEFKKKEPRYRTWLIGLMSFGLITIFFLLTVHVL
ncbi:hypothetical protein KKH43_04740 [Patescibacteria group bacterium]|nr:hypothetical protein [Patescibacteria group bacterium]